MELQSTQLKCNIANNIVKLRQAFGMTQLELAEKLNYSDKAVSKWERGESLPDVIVLKMIADQFGVTIDYLTEHHFETMLPATATKRQRTINRIFTALLPTLSIWFVATLVFVILLIAAPDITRPWLAYLFAVPVSAMLLLIFNVMWGRSIYSIICISFIIWSVLAIVFFFFSSQRNAFTIFAIGIPLELILLIAFGIGKTKKPKKKEVS